MKRCPKCEQWVPDGEFGKASYCKVCYRAYQREIRDKDRAGYNAYQKAYRDAYPEQRAKYRRRAWLKRQYGTSIEEFDEMLDQQNGRCAICREELIAEKRPGMASVAVDHDHSSGRVRGLLCGTCNVGIGLLKSVEVVARALDYLCENERV